MRKLSLAAALLAFTAITQAAPAAPKLTTLYRFTGYRDGAYPGPLVAIGNVLYGATYFGNVPGCQGGGDFGCGTLFSLNLATGKENVVHRFTGGADGLEPTNQLLLDVTGVLYGSTFGGGTSSLGTLYSFNTKTGAERVLYNIDRSDMGAVNDLILSQSSIYTSSYYNENSPGGAIYKFDLSGGAQRIIWSFPQQANQNFPNIGAVSTNGEIYGTTYGGNQGPGVVFRLNPVKAHYKVVYAFPKNQSAIGVTSLLAQGNRYYGAAQQGGTGNGSIFEVTPHGVGSEIYAFKNDGKDGKYPNSLVFDHGALYGTTELGGGDCRQDGCGTVFKIDLATGTETVLHRFKGGADGAFPTSGLVHLGNAWYGTTESGGSPNHETVSCPQPDLAGFGCGTVFKLTE